MTGLEEFTEAVIKALYFTDTGEEGQPGKGDQLADETRVRLEADCTSFWYRMRHFLQPTGMTATQAGHDFWLTRNHHGAGFWDGDWPEPPATWLARLADGYGEFEIYRGDDGLIYV